MRKGSRLLIMISLLGALSLSPNFVVAGQANPNPSTSSSRPKTNRKNQYKFGNTVITIRNQRLIHHQLSESQIKANLHQLRAQTLHDIRIERAEHVSPDIKISPKLNRLAELRARQVAKRFSHYNRNHKPMTTVDARKAGLPDGFQGSENIASCSLGNCTVIADPKVYHNRNGKDMANMSNDGMMNYDAFEQNGHRRNILSGDNSRIGIGAAYSPRKRTFYLAEDFGNEDPQSSEDLNKQPIHFHLKRARQVTIKSLWRTGLKWGRLIISWVKSRI